MNFLKAKPAVVIIGTLIIGMILGALGLSVFMHYRMQHLHNMMGRNGFQQRLLESISPLSDSQRRAVEQVIDLSSVKIDSTISLSRLRMDAIIDSMIAQLDTQLSAEQKARMHKTIGLRPPRHGAPPFGLPPFGGPPPDRQPHGGPPPHDAPPDGPPPREPGDRPPPPPHP
jgi:hypothetical protein